MHALTAPGRGPLPTVVLLHGLGSAAIHLGALMLALRGHARRVVALDLPGHGDSEVPSDGLTPRSLERGLLGALDGLVSGECVVFGNSLGGAAALRFALARPERVRALVLASPAGASMSQPAFERFRESVRVDSHARAMDFIDRAFVRPPWPRDLLAWGTRQKFASPQVRSLLASTRAQDAFSAHELRSIHAPTLLLWPRGDRVFPPGCKEFFATHLRRGTLVEPAGVGHSPYLEDLAGTLGVMIPWLQQALRDGTAIPPRS
jgi:pimeloyl-ACP methyl ester carboxylesterase